MKPFILIFLVLNVILCEAQCDSVDYVLEGTFVTNTSKNPKINFSHGDVEPKIGQLVNISKYFETLQLGFSTSGWIDIAKAVITSKNNDFVSIKIIEELSEITVNGQKKNHFEKGNKIKVEWRGKSQTKPYFELEGEDTLVKGQFKCGKRDGLWKSFFVNNRVKTIAYYKNGLYHGPYQIFHENGYVLESGHKKDGKTEGIVTYYYSDGSTKKTLEFENNQLNGDTKSFSEKGLVTHLETYKNDLLFGPAKSYYASGKIKLEATYNHEEKLDGLLKKYREDGSLEFEREYKSGKKNRTLQKLSRKRQIMY